MFSYVFVLLPYIFLGFAMLFSTPYSVNSLSASFSGNLEGCFWTCVRLLPGVFGRFFDGSIEDNYPEQIGKNQKAHVRNYQLLV